MRPRVREELFRCAREEAVQAMRSTRRRMSGDINRVRVFGGACEEGVDVQRCFQPENALGRSSGKGNDLLLPNLMRLILWSQ